MQTPQKNAPQSAKKSSKQNKPYVSAQSDNDAYVNASQEGSQTPSKRTRKQRKQSNARKNGVQSDIGEIQEHEGAPRPVNYPAKHKNTPAKAIRSDAYAGPTFHQSPAASAIPMPSFMPRSLPNHAPISNLATATDGSIDIKRDETPPVVEPKRDPTPLDWMFDAARQSQVPPNAASPARRVSPPTQSPRPSPGPKREEADFPFELEGVSDSNKPYSTPFSQRLAASRTPHSTSEGGQSLTAEERKAKTAALKRALMNNGTPSPLGSPFNDNNPFNARNVTPNGSIIPRHASNPSTPSYQNGYVPTPNDQYFSYGPASPSRNINGPPPNRPPSSNLRNIYNPAVGPTPMSPPNTAPPERTSTARSPPPQRQLNFGSNFGAIYGNPSRPASEGNPVGHNPKPSLEQGLDDLRKVLNLSSLGQT